MENLSRTIYGSYLQTCMFMGQTFQMKPHTTLNERFSVQAGVAPAAGALPNLGYWCYGIGGHKASVGIDGIALTESIPHAGDHAGLYLPLPFVLREETNDLDVTERLKYALRRVETHGGKRYYAYYLRRMNENNVTPVMEKLVIDSDGNRTVTPFVPDESNLNPEPPSIIPNTPMETAGEYTQVASRVDLSLTAAEVEEIRNVAMVLYQDDRYAMITEIGLCTGLDKTVDSPWTGNSVIQFKEAICVQIAAHAAANYPLKSSSQGVEILLDCGISEPLFRLLNA